MPPFKSPVAIIGAGSQGRRLAYMVRDQHSLSHFQILTNCLSQWSSRGNDVHLVDGQPAQLRDSVRAVAALRQSLPSQGTAGTIRTFAPDALKGALNSAWLVVEVSSLIHSTRYLTYEAWEQCVPERLALKRQVILQLDQQAAEDTIIASNSSSYSCVDILDGLDWKHPSRILSAHTCKSAQVLRLGNCSCTNRAPRLAARDVR